MRKNWLIVLMMVLGGGLILGGLQTGWAQGDEFTLQEITVTAQKRKEKVQDVPVAITVANREQIERQQINEITDMARISPALDFTDPQSGPSGAGIIRGIGTVSWQQTTVGSVAIVVDDVPGGRIPNNNIFDIERVEILRGPQGMLFGQSASAGVINMVTVAPDLTGFSGYAHVEYSNKGTAGSRFGQELFRGALNVPITDNSALRISALANTYRGIQKNLYYDKDQVDKNYGVRARYLYSPSDALSINLIADYNDRDEKGPNAFTLIYAVPGSSTAESAANGGYTAEEGNQDSYTDAKVRRQKENYGLSAQIDYTIADHTLTSITAYRDLTEGPDFSSVFPYAEPFHLKIEAPEEYKESDQFTQEFRITSPSGGTFEYVAGLFYSTFSSQTGGQGTNVSVWMDHPPFLPFPFVGYFQVSPPAEVEGYLYGAQTDSLAGYGQLTYHLSDNASLFAGVRLTRQEVELDTESRATGEKGGLSDKETNFSWRVGGQYRFNPGVMAYGSVTRGYKPGSIAEQTMDATGTIVYVPGIIEPEEPLSIEVGIKSSLLNNRVALDANVFHNTVKNFQGQFCRPSQTGNWECISQNISEVVSKGFEIDVIGRPMAGLDITSGLIYVSAEYPDGYLDADQITDIGGKQLKNVPKWKFVLSADYTHKLTDTLLAYLALDGTYKTEVQMYEPISTQQTIFPAFWDLGAQVGVRSADNTWGISLWGRNLLDENEPHFMVLETDGEVSAIYGNQSFRQVGITLDYRF